MTHPMRDGILAVVAHPSVTRSQRLELIVAMMQTGEWVRGKSAPMLAGQWNVETNTVERMAAEAWNIVKREIQDVETVKQDVAQILRRDIDRASAEGRYSDTAKLGDVLTRILGARVADKHEVVTMTEEQAAAKYREITGRDWEPKQ